jgi:Janus kinase 2
MLGSGYFGEVYSAKMNNAENKIVDVALKRITKQKFRNKNDAQMFLHEIKMHSKLIHPNILPLWGVSKVDTGEGRGDYFMVMPYMANGNLCSLIKKKPKAITSKLGGEILKGVAQGMAYLHSLKPQPIIHRDLTSLNILLDNSARPLISDFGLSRFKPIDETMTGAIGSLVWMSPEVFRGLRYGEPSDVYSFSIIAYEIFVKSLPCTQDESSVFASMVALKDHRPDLSVIPPMPRREEWTTLISDCWKPLPSDRPTFPQILVRLKELGF